MGGPGGNPASAGQMIWSTLPAASVASTTPGSAGTGINSAVNVSGPPGMTDVFVPDSVTLQVPEMNETAGGATDVHVPIALSQPAGMSPTRSTRRRPVRNWGTAAVVRTTSPPSPPMFAQG